MKPTYGDPEPLINEAKYTVSKEFILEAYNAACKDWKRKIEEQFSELFPKGDQVVYTTIYKSDDTREVVEIFYFSIGDNVEIIDGSYHTTPEGVKVKNLGFTNPKGVIVYNKCDRTLDSIKHIVSLNLIIKLEDGRVVFSAPSCVEKIY